MRRERVGEDEARRDRGIEERVPLDRDRRRPVVSARDRHVQILLVVERRLAETANQAALRDRRAVDAQVRVVDRHEVRIEEVLALQRIGVRLVSPNLVPDQTADREVLRDVAAVDVEQRLGVDVARDVVGLIDDAVARVAVRALGMPQQLVLVRVRISADVGLDVSP